MGLSLRKLGGKIFDQINPFDNGKTYQNSAGNGQTGSVVHQIGQFGTALARPPAQFINTTRAGVGGAYGLGRLGISSLFGSDQDYKNRLVEVSRTLTKDLNPDSGVLGQGTYFKNRAEAQNLTPRALAGKSIAQGAQLAPFVLPETKFLSNPVVNRLATNAVIGGTGSAAGQYAENGKINPKTVATSAATAAALGEVIPVAKAIAKGSKPVLASEAGSVKLPGPGNGVEKTIGKIMREEGLNREQATVRMDELLRRDVSPNLSINGAAPSKPRVEIAGKAAKNPAVKEVLGGISKSRGKSSVEGSLVAADIATKAKQLGVTLDKDFTDRYQAGQLATPAEQALGAHIKGITDELFKKQQALDPSIEYRKNYVPQSYANTEAEVNNAISKLQQNTGAANRRNFSTYQEAAQYGLNPRHNTIDAMIGESAASAERALQNRDIVNQGLQSGLFSTKPGNGVQVIGITDPAGNPVFAQKKVADTFNGVLQHDSTQLGQALHKTARAFEVGQDVMLQGGVPGTNANFFVFGQGVKDTTRNIGKATLHPIQAVKQEGHLIGDFLRGKMKTQERFSTGSFKAGGQTIKNTNFVKELADHGLYIDAQTSLSGAGKGSVRRGWNSLGNNPTFGRYMPNRMLSTAQEVYSQAVDKLGHDAAVQLAADTTKTFTGHVDTILKGRSNITNDVNGLVFFAPKYRESIIGALNNVVKSVYPKNWTDPKFAPSRQLLAGMVVTLGAYEAMNRKLTGHSMMENRQGQELSLEIPYGPKDAKGNQPVINVPFMPGFMTIPRAIAGAVSAAKNADVKGVTAQASKALSAPLQIAGNVAANKDYFSRPIFIDQKTADQEGVNPDSAAVAGAKVAGYVGGQLSPAWVRGILDKASGKPTGQAIATALEAPVRFGKQLNPETTAYFKDRDEIYNALDKNDKAAWDLVHPKLKNIRGEYIADKSVDAGLARASVYLDHPNVLKADNEMSARAKARGQKTDPFYDLSDQQQRIALRIQTLPPKDPQKTKLEKDNPWYRSLSRARNEFFDSLPPGDPNKPKAPIEFPEPSAQVAALKDAYYQMTDSTMKRKFLENNPEVADQFAKEEQYSRAIRAAKNLPQYDKYPTAPKDVQNLMDFYNALPKGEANGKSKIRSAWIKSHPNEWAKITDQYSRVAQFNLQNDAEMANFEGENLTEKGIKSIASLAKDLGVSTGGGSGFGSGFAFSKKPPTPGSAYQYAVTAKGNKGAPKPSVNIKQTALKSAKKVATVKPKVTSKKSLV